MAYFVRAPGTCGEFIQGSIDGHPFLVTCPINRYSYAISKVAQPFPHMFCSLQPKAALARKRVLDLLRVPVAWGHSVYTRSEIPQGKGMASSSADIGATAMATGLAHGHRLTLDELATICLSIEPSDASFYPGIVQFDYIHGTMANPLGHCPPLKIIIFDEGGSVDTLTFNARADLRTLIAEKEELIKEALHLFKEGMAMHDISLIGQAATISSFANQRILPKQSLYTLHEIGDQFHSVGTIIAHSGTIIGLLFPIDFSGEEACIAEVKATVPHVRYLDTVETTNEGITFMKR